VKEARVSGAGTAHAMGAKLGLSARLVPRVIVDGATRMQAVPTRPNAVTLVGQPEPPKVVEAEGVLSGSSTIRASGAISQGIGMKQTISGHKVEVPAEPAQVEVPAEPAEARRGRRRVSTAWNEWEFSTIEFGACVGAIANALTGDVVGYGRSAAGGALITYLWGCWRLWDENRRR
jgi:hypothetical protein